MLHLLYNNVVTYLPINFLLSSTLLIALLSRHQFRVFSYNYFLFISDIHSTVLNPILLVIMVQLSSVFAGVAICLLTSAAPLSIPLGTSGKTLTLSADGESITLDGQTVNLSQAMALSKSCIGEKGGSSHKGSNSWNGTERGEEQH